MNIQSTKPTTTTTTTTRKQLLAAVETVSKQPHPFKLGIEVSADQFVRSLEKFEGETVAEIKRSASADAKDSAAARARMNKVLFAHIAGMAGGLAMMGWGSGATQTIGLGIFGTALITALAPAKMADSHMLKEHSCLQTIENIDTWTDHMHRQS